MAGGRKYAKGRHAVAECQRSGQKMRYRDLVEDGHTPGLLVHPDWWEPKHPQEIPITVDDPVALFRPAPEISVEEGLGDPENLDGGSTPTTTFNPPAGTISVGLTGGEVSIATDEAVTFPWNEWLFIELDGGGFFVSRITTGANNTPSPTFFIPFTSAFVGTASAGNNFHIGEGTP